MKLISLKRNIKNFKYFGTREKRKKILKIQEKWKMKIPHRKCIKVNVERSMKEPL